MKFNAMTVSQYCHLVKPWHPLKADEETEQKMRLLGTILDKLEPQGMDNYHSIWVKAKRPTFRQYYEYYYEYDNPYKDAKPDFIEKARQEYLEDYPLPVVWFRLAMKHFTRSSGEDFYGLFVRNEYLFSVNDCNATEVFHGVDLLDWAIEESEKFVQSVSDGTYLEILQKIPYIYREGTIERRIYWEFMPETKKAFLAYYSKREVRKFLRDFEEDFVMGTVLPEMTARTFYEACAVIYKALKKKSVWSGSRFTEEAIEKFHYDPYNEGILTPKEMYYNIADGRDDGLKNVPMDDAQEFQRWRNNKGPYYDFNGSHPWEIITSYSLSLSMHLFPSGSVQEGFYFELDGSSARRAPETIIAANALMKAGYPVCVCNFNKIKKRIEGTDTMDVVPEYMFAFSESSIHLPKGQAGLDIAKHTEWEIVKYKMKGTGENR